MGFSKSQGLGEEREKEMLLNINLSHSYRPLKVQSKKAQYTNFHEINTKQSQRGYLELNPEMT